MRKALLLIAFAATLASVETALPQVYPSRPITMVVSFTAGGPLDIIGRTITEPMREIESWWPTIKAANIKGE